MPSLKSSAIHLSADRYQPVKPPAAGGSAPPQHAPVFPPYLSQSSLMLSSLPSIATNVTAGAVTQFYGGRSLPIRQVILP